MDLFAGLNPQQLEAVRSIDGRLLVLAGAGSGKTRVLTLRMAHLIKNLGCPPTSILGLTFTNKAAAEMRHRLGTMIEPKVAKQVTLCTFHSFCMQVLRADIRMLGYTSDFSLYDEKDVQRLVNLIARDLLEHEGELPSLAPTTGTISMAKNRGVQPEHIGGTGSEWHDDFTRTLYKRLQDSMRAYNAVDFDSLLSLTVELFEKHPDVLNAYQERFRYIMIDEYQDTNPVQFRLASLLSSKYGNLCVVGDDDQSIYGWRGADIQNILDFPDAKTVKLEQNYRSTSNILKSANAVIANNSKRHGKALWSTKGEGSQIEVFHAPNEVDEASAIVCRMDKLREREGLRWKDIAILYRSNALSRPIEQALLKHMWKDGAEWIRGVPYQIFGGTEFYERREVKDLLAYLRVLFNPSDQEALLRIINHPRRGIGEGSLDHMTAYNRKENIPLWSVINQIHSGDTAVEHVREKIPSKALQGISQFINVMEQAKERFITMPMREAMVWLVETIDYRKAIHEEVKSSQMREFKWENVQDFVSSMADFEQKMAKGEDRKSLFQDFLSAVTLEEGWGADARKNKEENKVTLMTFHSAKGLEFPACFLVGMEDHIIPHEKSVKETGVEEERRLMYVAITRAMKHLTMSMARQRKRMGVEVASTPSRFMLEIPKEFMKVTLWHQLE